MQTENDTSKPEDSPEQETGEGCSGATCSRLFRVQVTFDTVIYAENEKAAKQKVKYGTGEIDDMPVSVLAMPIESSDGLPAGWNTGCLPWGDAPENTTIGEILNVKEHAPLSARASVDHGVEVEGRKGHVNRAADRGCVARLVVLLIFGGQAANAASSPLDQIPPPSASFLLISFLVAVLGALYGAWVNPTQPDNIDTTPANQSQRVNEEKIIPKTQECKKIGDSSTSSALSHPDEKA